ncbi:hypothetical protein NBG84_35700, partial [Streptomyces sp. CWNU-1]|nr:hypothetical protein [Streptomyces sp. CWNU-1]
TAELAKLEAAVISRGDSFISGEAGRWQGNADTSLGSRYGTDRAAYGCTPGKGVLPRSGSRLRPLLFRRLQPLRRRRDHPRHLRPSRQR